MIEVNFPER